MRGLEVKVEPIELAMRTDLARGLQQLIVKLHDRMELGAPIRMYIAGGMACHLYTAARVTTDVDAEFSKRIILPQDLVVETADGNMLYLDTNYNSAFALMHEDYLTDTLKVPLGTDLIEVFLLSPIDLIVSKIARFNGPDESDIAELIRTFKISASAIQERSEQALQGYVGNAKHLQMNLRDVLTLARRLADPADPQPAPLS